MLVNTTAFVLRNVRYGETSLISTLYTKAFGLQSYLIRGARANKKSGIHASYFQLGQLLEITAYHKPGKSLQTLKEVGLSKLRPFQEHTILQQSVAQYCTELILRCVKEEEQSESLFEFIERAFITMYDVHDQQLANFPIHFTLLFAEQIGFAITNNFSPERQFFDATVGQFTNERHASKYTLDEGPSKQLVQFLGNKQEGIKSSGQLRKNMLEALLLFLKLHVEQMQDIKSLAILHELVND